jgi:VWFA-related protein
MVSRDAPPTFRAKVNLVLVPVVVRDRDGHAVGNLKKEDFQLFDKGKPQTISRFSVESGKGSEIKLRPDGAAVVATPAAPGEPEETKPGEAPPKRFVAYLFDDMHLSFGDLAQTRWRVRTARPYFQHPAKPCSTSRLIARSCMQRCFGCSRKRGRVARTNARPCLTIRPT